MFCDIYNLGAGPVCAIELQKVFGISNLQVIEGFTYERIPKAVLEQACGTLGKWNGGDPPRLEITYHHEGSQYWKQLPARLRTPSIKLSGTAAELVPLAKDDPERKLYNGSRHPMKLRDDPPPRGLPPPRLEEILPDFIKSLNQGTVGPRPQAMPTSPMMPRAVAPPVTMRPPAMENEVLIDGKMVPLVGASVVETKAPGLLCVDTKGDGSPCGRTATMSGKCGYHARKR